MKTLDHEKEKTHASAGLLHQPFSSALLFSVILVSVLMFSTGCEVSITTPLKSTPRVGDLELTPIETVSSETMELIGGSNGSVWVVTKYEILRFPQGDLEKRRVVIDPQIYQQRFGKSMGAFSSAGLASDGVLWVGSWDGLVFRFHRGTWVNYITEDHGFGGKVSGIVLNKSADVMWMGGWDALWEAVKKGNSLDFVIEDRIEDVALGADGSVLAITDDEVYRYTRSRDASGESEVLWALEDGDKGWVSSVTSRGSGWLVGTKNGFFQIEPSGETTDKQLEGEWVMTALDHPDGLIIGSWQNGLFFESEAGWLRISSDDGLPGDSVTSLHVDREQRLWIGLYDGGTVVADLAALRKEAEKIGPVR